MALNELLAHMEEQGGRWVVTSTLDAMGESKYGTHRIPICEGEAVLIAGVYQCAANGIEVCLRNVKATEYEAYVQTLWSDGWVKYTENTISVSVNTRIFTAFCPTHRHFH